MAELLPAAEADDRGRVDVARAVAGAVAVEQQAAVRVHGVENAIAAVKEVAELLPAAQADDRRIGHVAGAVARLVAVEQQAAVPVHGVEDTVAAGEQVAHELPAALTDDRRAGNVARAVAPPVAVEQQLPGGVDGVDDAVAAGEQVQELIPAAEADDARRVDVARAVARRVAVEQQLAGLEGRTAVVHHDGESARHDAGHADGDVVVRDIRLADRQSRRRQQLDGRHAVLRVAQWVGRLHAVDDDAFAGDAALELVDAPPGLDHEIGHAPANAHGRHPARRRRLDETDGVQVIGHGAAAVDGKRRRVEPLDGRLRIGRGVGGATARHLIERAHVAAKWVQVAEAGQGVHELHRPDPDALQHDEARPEAGRRARAGAAEHDDGRGVEALVAQLPAELVVEDVGWHVLLVDDLHGQHGGVEVGAARRGGVDVGAERAVHARRGVGVMEHAPQDVDFPVRWNLVWRESVRAVHRHECQFLASNPGHDCLHIARPRRTSAPSSVMERRRCAPAMAGGGGLVSGDGGNGSRAKRPCSGRARRGKWATMTVARRSD